jgi:hypothetical protein
MMFFLGKKIHWTCWVATLYFCFYYPRSGINFQEQKRSPRAAQEDEKMAKLRLPIIFVGHKMKLSESIILSVF